MSVVTIRLLIEMLYLYNTEINYMSIGIAQLVCSIMTVHALTNSGNTLQKLLYAYTCISRYSVLYTVSEIVQVDDCHQ